MSPSLWLILPDALHNHSRGRIHPGCPCGWLKDRIREEWREPPPNNCHPFVGNLPLTTSAPCVPLSYSLPGVHSVTVCFTLDHPLSHSLSPTSIKYLSSIAVSFSVAASLSVVNSSFSQLSPLSAHSLHLPRLLSLHLDCSSSSLSPLSVPLSSPLIRAHSVFIQLCSLPQFGRTRLIASLPLHSTLCLQP